MQRGRPFALDQLEPEQVQHYFEVVEGCNRRAEAAGASPAGERTFDVGGYSVRVRSPNAMLLARMTAALAHLVVEQGSLPDLTIQLWDATAADAVPPSPLAWYFRERCGGDGAPPADALIDPRGELPAFNTERFRTAFHLWPNTLELLDAVRNVALFWIRDAFELPIYEAGSPFRRLLAWWMVERDRFLVHAAAVGTPAGGVLLVGPGGAGKSTSALACLGAGLGYAGDDYCLVALEPTPRVYSLYNTAKLKSCADLQRFPQLRPLVENADRLGQEKALIFLHDQYAGALIRGFPLRAVLIPSVTDRTVARLSQVSAVAALQALAPSTLRQLPGQGRRAWPLMARLVRVVPSYRLELGPALASIPPLIEQLLARR